MMSAHRVRTLRRRLRPAAAVLVASAILIAADVAAASPPDSQEVAQQFLDAFRDGTAEEVRVDAIEEAKSVDDPIVVELVARALRDRSVTVRRAAIDALGAISHPDALLELHKLYRGRDRLRRDEETFVHLLRAIGRKGDPESIEVLTDDVFDRVTLRTLAARIHGLGRIRTDASLEALYQLTTLTGSPSRRVSPPGTDTASATDRTFRLSFAELTGRDLGVDRAAWQRWWQESGQTFRVSSERPHISRSLAAEWEHYWGERYYAGQAPPPAPHVGPPMEIVANPTPAQVDAALAAIRDAFVRGRPASSRITAIATFGGVQDDTVVAAIANGLDDPDDGVRLAAIDTLGWLPSARALELLHRLYRQDRALRKDEVAFARLLQAIGRHGDSSSLDVLKDHPFSHLTLASGKARILGIARCRDPRSIDLLIRGMRLAGGDPRGTRSGTPRFMDDFRLALAVLIGEDLGLSKDAWESWRREHPDFLPSAEKPPVSVTQRIAWEEYWSEDY